ncbi:MAG TPA: methyltransferase domain-containing protein [Gemmataceae bacterium]|nr:methyltransferase domain-containing protein [Gemmataceae bacterium]
MAQRRGKQESLPPCYAMVFPGLEAIAEEEIAADLHGDVKRSSGEIVVFRVPEIDAALLQLRTVEDVFLLAWGTDKLSRRATDLERIRRWTSHDADWNRLLSIHHTIRPKPKGKPTYRLVTQMTGEHGYRRTDARKALAEGLSGKLPASWRHAEEDAAVEIWLTIIGGTAVCGVRLSDRTMRHRKYKLEHLPASLRPTVAAAMVHLADIKPGEVVLDPMCGAGTILAEALAWARHCNVRLGRVVGGDIEKSALRAAEPNLRRLGEVTLTRWDARALPLADQSVDRIVCNPPFGKQLASPEEIGPLYGDALADWNRVLRPGGRAVLLVSDRAALREAAERVNWRFLRQLRVRVLGQPAFLSVWRKD